MALKERDKAPPEYASPTFMRPVSVSIVSIIKKHRGITWASLAFAVVYSLISLVNHYLFRTYALDLGLYTNALYKYAHLRMADSTMIKDFYEPILGGHFDLYLMIFSPIVYLFGTYSLLVVQIAALILGGLGVYRYFLYQDKRIALYAAVYFFLFYGVYGALSFDYHSVVVASGAAPWFFVAIRAGRKWLAFLVLVFMLASQENVSLWVIFICLGLAIEYRNDAERALLLLSFAGLSLAYFLVVVHDVIPSFAAHGEYGGFRYSALGGDAWSAIQTVLTHPIESLKMLFINHNHTPDGDFVKAETHVILLISGVWILFKKPHYLLMLLPIYGQKFFHDSYHVWSIGGQYNIEFTPILAIGIFSVIAEIKKPRLRKVASYAVLLSAAGATFRTMDETVFFTHKSRIRFYQKAHYQRDYDVKKVHAYLANIPPNAKVSAQSPFVPHLSLRERVYQFPLIKDAEYIVFSRKEENVYPLTKEAFEAKTRALMSAKEWEVHVNTPEITILRRRQ